MSKIDTSALVVLSGGQDSTTCLFWAKHYFERVHAITFDYGQLHSIEIQAACRVAVLAGVESHEIVTLGDYVLKGTSPLTNKTVPLEQYTDFESMSEIIGNRVEKTFVPMRNALFLTLAANRAICLGTEHVVTGVCQEDNANYPDCRRIFIDLQEDTIASALGLNSKFCIHTPLMNLSKAESVRLAQQLGAYAALAWTHTAYDGQYPPLGRDHASVLREQGFLAAGVPDPLVVRAVGESLMSPPPGDNYEQREDFWAPLNTEIRHQRDVLSAAGVL
jgi:7-cyano-7-deazaguanine synthase